MVMVQFRVMDTSKLPSKIVNYLAMVREYIAVITLGLENTAFPPREDAAP